MLETWPCDLCLSGNCGDTKCHWGRKCQAALCTPPLRQERDDDEGGDDAKAE